MENNKHLSRRNALGSLGSLALLSSGIDAALSAPGDQRIDPLADSSDSNSRSSMAARTSTSSRASSVASNAGSCVLTPIETQGPYPLFSTIVGHSAAMRRQDITEGKTGVPLSLILTLVDANSCTPLTGHDIYIWHCDKDGLYSGYSNSQNPNQAGFAYLRGVQSTDDNGQVTFKTIFPGWYSGNITHIHFRAFLSSTLEITSQLCFPQDITTAVYNSSLYTKGQNTSVNSFSADNVFGDGAAYQMCAMSGSLGSGYSASLTVGIDI